MFKQLLKRELANTYRGAALGLFWMLIKPAITALILFVVFRVVLGFKDPLYLVFLIVGVLSWNLLSSALLGMTTSLKRSSSIVKNLPSNLFLFPAVSVSVALIEFAVGLLVLIPTFWFYGQLPSLNFVVFPLVLLLQLVGQVGLGLVLCVSYPIAADVRSVTELALRLLYFASPVFYNPSIIPNDFIREWYMFNPMATLLALYRWSLIGGDSYPIPEARHLVVCFLVCSLTFLMGLFVFRAFRNSAVKSL